MKRKVENKVKKEANIYQRRRILVFFGIFLCLVILLGIILILSFKSPKEDYYSPDSRVDQVRTTIVEDSETIGWINVQGTDIDYPVVYETNLVYLGLKDYLWLSNRYIEGNNRIAIYGHNIKNVSSKPLITNEDHTRFEQLLSFVYYDFAKENMYIQYSSGGKDELYKIYAVGFYDKQDEEGKYLDNKEEIKSYIETAKDTSIYDYSVEVKEDDFLISLITCTRFFGANEKTTFRVDARKVRTGEKINKYSVQKNQNYDILNLE